MITDKDLLNIDLYLDKKLQDAEKIAFENELKTRPELLEEARHQRRIMLGFKALKEKEVKENLLKHITTLNAVQENATTETVSFKPQGRVISFFNNKTIQFAAAASFIGVIAVASFFLLNKESGLSSEMADKDVPKINTERPIEETPVVPRPSRHTDLALNENQKLYNQYYVETPMLRGDLPKEYVKAVNAYFENNPTLAIKLLPKKFPSKDGVSDPEKLDSLQNSIDFLAFYRGISYLKINDYEKAIIDLTVVSESSNLSINDFSNWYLAILYLRTNQTIQAKNKLQEISQNEDSRFSAKAFELLGKIK